MTVPEDEIKDIKASMTLVGGKVSGIPCAAQYSLPIRHRFSMTKKSFRIRHFPNRRLLTVEHHGGAPWHPPTLAFFNRICVRKFAFGDF
jgi:hypothetical protein